MYTLNPLPGFVTRQKPARGAVLNPSSIWTKGLIFAALMNEGAGDVLDHYSKTRGALVGGLTWALGSLGPALTSPGGVSTDNINFGTSIYSRQLTQTPTTWVFRTTPTAQVNVAYAE